MPEIAITTLQTEGKTKWRPWTGLAATFSIGTVAFSVHGVLGLTAFSPAIIAAVLGLFIAHFVHLPRQLDAGITFSSRTLLRFAVALLGLQVTFTQVIGLGWVSFIILALAVITTFMVISRLGHFLGVDAKLCELIAAGTSICGAAAVAGVNAVTEAPEEDVAYAVALVTIFGTVAMLVYPAIYPMLGLDSHHYGLWVGGSIHEVAQVAGATTQVGTLAMQSGTVAKLTRVVMLAPVVMGLTVVTARPKGTHRAKVPPLPIFVVGFVALIVLGSLFPIPALVKFATGQISGFLLAVALGAMGLKTHVGAVMKKGPAPLLLGALGTLFISLFTLGLIHFFA